MDVSKAVTPATARLERSLWRALVQFLPHAVLLLDDKLSVVLANDAASRLFRAPITLLTGLSIAALLPRKNVITELMTFGPQRRKILETMIDPTGSDDARATVRIIAMRLARRNGRRQKLDRAMPPSEYRLLVIEDITERAMLEQQLVESEKQAALGQLAAGILHEVSNPLAGLGSNLVFVRGAMQGQAHRLEQALDVSLEQLDAMRQLLGTLSGFPGRGVPAFQPTNLLDVLRRSAAFIRNEAQRCNVRIESSLPSSSIVCDLDVRMIRQVVLNVLKNAIEAMPDGGRLDLRARVDEHDPATVTVEIADTGTGIADADLRKVFRPLFSTKPRGAGLGLSFCRQTVEEHGGQIRLTSPGLDRGTVVTITLPLCRHTAS
jgi:signal transduction histidine kinase